MNRRAALKQAMIIAGGVAFIPSCVFDTRKVSIALNNLDISVALEELMGVIVDTIIPQTDTPGATDLNLHYFVLVMIDDCKPKKEHDLFMKGLMQFEEHVESTYGQMFRQSSPVDREKLLHSIEQQPGDQLFKAFVREVKTLTIRGFMSSQFVLSAITPYQLIPGEYRGCVPFTGKITI